MANRGWSLVSRLKFLRNRTVPGPQEEGALTRTAKLWQVARLFGTSVATYSACDAAAVVVAGQDISLTAQAGLIAVYVGYGPMVRSLTKLGHNSSLAKVLDRVTPRPSLTHTLPLRLFVPTHMAAFALTGYAAYKLGFLEVAHHHRLKNGELEAVPLSGRLRPALPAVTAMERRVRSQEVVGKRSDAALQRVARDGGFYYPADHPLTLKAQAICQQLLPAAMLLLEEHHGRDSPVVAQVKGHFADWQPVIKVYHAEGDSSQGFASQGFIAVRDTLSVPIIAHELGHTICRHATESAASSKAFSSTWVPWAFTTYLGHLVTMRPTGSVVLFALARNILLYRATKSPPTVLRSSKAKKLPGTARLQPGDVGYNSVESPSRDIDHELEAERMAMFIMARVGYNPVLVLHHRVTFPPEHPIYRGFVRWEGLSKHEVSVLVQSLQETAGEQPEPLATISRAELAAGTDTAWPNLTKLLHCTLRCCRQPLMCSSSTGGPSLPPNGLPGSQASSPRLLAWLQLRECFDLHCVTLGAGAHRR